MVAKVPQKTDATSRQLSVSEEQMERQARMGRTPDSQIRLTAADWCWDSVSKIGHKERKLDTARV